MKCVKNASNEVRRVSEDRAKELVTKGWAYVPKSEWKAAPDTSWVKNVTPPNPEGFKKQRKA